MAIRSLLTKTLPFYLVLSMACEVARAHMSELPEVAHVGHAFERPADALPPNGLDAHRVRPLSPYEPISAKETAHRHQSEWIAEPPHTERPDYPRTRPPTPVEAPTVAPTCDLDPLAERQGQHLVDYILGSPVVGCLEYLVQHHRAPPSLKSPVFRMANMLTVAEEAKTLSTNYRGDRSEDVRKMFLFLRAGHYNRFYRLQLDWDDARVRSASAAAADALFMSDAFFDLASEEHGAVATEAFGLTHYLDISRFVSSYKRWLKELAPERVEYKEMASATSGVLQALFRGHWEYYIGAEGRTSFLEAIGSDMEFPNVLLEVALSTEIYDAAPSVSENAARELARFLKYGTPSSCRNCPLPIFSSVVSATRSIFGRYVDISERGASVMLIAANVIYAEDLCELVDICDLRDKVEADVLPIRHQCSDVSVTIRAQSLPEKGRVSACELLVATNRRFHALLMTHDDDPVEDDLNDHLHVIVYSSPTSYRTYSRFLFGNSTDNGGIFREGNPASETNIPLIIVFEANWVTDPDQDYYPVLSLAHEYVHYLDARFVKRGASWDYGGIVVGWAEGLAEYVSLLNDHPWALDLAAVTDDPPDIGTILRATYLDESELVYTWGYLAVRFLFEQRPAEVQKIVRLLRAGEYDKYDEYISELAALNGDFFRWLEVVVHVSLSEIVLGEPVSTEEGRATVNLLPHFFPDLDGEGIVFTAEVESGGEVASIMLSGASLVILPESPGVLTVRVSARYRGFVWHQSFEAVVTDECPDYLCRSRPSWWWAVFADASEAEASQDDSVEESLPR